MRFNTQSSLASHGFRARTFAHNKPSFPPPPPLATATEYIYSILRRKPPPQKTKEDNKENLKRPIRVLYLTPCAPQCARASLALVEGLPRSCFMEGGGSSSGLGAGASFDSSTIFDDADAVNDGEGRGGALVVEGGGEGDGMSHRLRLELRGLKAQKLVEKGVLGATARAGMAFSCRQVCRRKEHQEG